MNGSRVACELGSTLPADLKRGEVVARVNRVETIVGVSWINQVSGSDPIQFEPVYKTETEYRVLAVYKVGNRKALRPLDIA